MSAQDITNTTTESAVEIRRRSGTGRQTTVRQHLTLFDGVGKRTGLEVDLSNVPRDRDGFPLASAFYAKVQMPEMQTFDDDSEFEEASISDDSVEGESYYTDFTKTTVISTIDEGKHTEKKVDQSTNISLQISPIAKDESLIKKMDISPDVSINFETQKGNKKSQDLMEDDKELSQEIFTQKQQQETPDPMHKVLSQPIETPSDTLIKKLDFETPEAQKIKVDEEIVLSRKRGRESQKDTPGIDVDLHFQHSQPMDDIPTPPREREEPPSKKQKMNERVDEEKRSTLDEHENLYMPEDNEDFFADSYDAPIEEESIEKSPPNKRPAKKVTKKRSKKTKEHERSDILLNVDPETPQSKYSIQRTPQSNISTQSGVDTPYHRIPLDKITPAKYAESDDSEFESSEDEEYVKLSQQRYLEKDKSFTVEGLQDEESEFVDDDEEEFREKRRRTRRNRMKPVAFWAGERPDMKHQTLRGKLRPKTPKRETKKRTERQKKKVKKRTKYVVMKDGKETQIDLLRTKDDIKAHDYQFKDEYGNESRVIIKMVFAKEQWRHGLIEIAPGSTKPEQNTHEFAEIFYVISGQVEVTVHNSKFEVSSGSHFYIPAHNIFKLKNISKNKNQFVKIVFFMVDETFKK